MRVVQKYNHEHDIMGSCWPLFNPRETFCLFKFLRNRKQYWQSNISASFFSPQHMSASKAFQEFHVTERYKRGHSRRNPEGHGCFGETRVWAAIVGWVEFIKILLWTLDNTARNHDKRWQSGINLVTKNSGGSTDDGTGPLTDKGHKNVERLLSAMTGRNSGQQCVGYRFQGVLLSGVAYGNH